METKWKQVEGFNGRYFVNDIGEVKSVGRRSRGLMRPNVCRSGYVRYTLYNKNNEAETKTPELAHRLVAKAFIPNPENKREVNHKNGIKTDNRVENLEWATSSENTIHAYNNNLIKTNYGEDCHNHKITESDVLDIRRRLASGETKTDVAKDYNVHRVHIGSIGNRKYWKHI